MNDTQHKIIVKKAKVKQTTLTSGKYHCFHCSGDPEDLASFGINLGDQVRIIRKIPNMRFLP